MNNKTTLSTLLLLVGAAGCALPTVASLPSTAADIRPSHSPVVDRPSVPQATSTLYARDGSVVRGPKPGAMAVTPATGQSALSDGGSRWTLLEQYQTALSEKEQIQFELESLAQALEQTEAREIALKETVEDLKANIAEAAEHVQTLESQNIELASRLTTAQIRRLQSEKLLLEAKLDWRRIQAAINAPEAPVNQEKEMSEATVDPLGSTNQ